MNRRALLLGAGALIVGEPARRVYSFLQDNPLAFNERARLMALIRAEVMRYCHEMLGKTPRPLNSQLTAGVALALKHFKPEVQDVSSSVDVLADRLVVNVRMAPSIDRLFFDAEDLAP